jgi:hypothetical protein
MGNIKRELEIITDFEHTVLSKRYHQSTSRKVEAGFISLLPKLRTILELAHMALDVIDKHDYSSVDQSIPQLILL